MIQVLRCLPRSLTLPRILHVFSPQILDDSALRLPETVEAMARAKPLHFKFPKPLDVGVAMRSVTDNSVPVLTVSEGSVGYPGRPPILSHLTLQVPTTLNSSKKHTCCILFFSYLPAGSLCTLSCACLHHAYIHAFPSVTFPVHWNWFLLSSHAHFILAALFAFSIVGCFFP